MSFEILVVATVRFLEAAGIAALLLGVGGVTVVVLLRAKRQGSWAGSYDQLRHGIGRAILLGLELLVGADILRTISEEPTLVSVAVLGGIVLIRTFLSFTLQVELEGRWPWQRASERS